ncbi:MAG TPA: phospholipase D-like domain-containing protein, partial [Pyrinomonadaceae bacterium]|nr:phospholipase D-like domain-containing protein [Pyrinomonadaceae bacterium]
SGAGTVTASMKTEQEELQNRSALRHIASRAFSRTSGAPLIPGNRVRLLRDAQENYPAWLEAISGARQHVHFESYIIHEDDAGWTFADALVAKAREGVRVRVLYDWLGGVGKTSRRFWKYLRAGGVEVRCYNTPRLDSPFGWLSRDHRKTISVDGEIGFVTGLCVGRMWVGEPAKKIEPWRDTGIEVRGPSVANIEQAFARVWDIIGEPLPADEIAQPDPRMEKGEVALRVVPSEPASAVMLRVDQLVATLARERLWLTDAYYAGTTLYVQALRAAAKDGVDVRLLVPSASDIPIVKHLSRAGYRPLLDSGVRIFEWNGTMLHAKTAVADGRWARVGSTNLNLASWYGNLELDVIVEDVPFAREMEETYLRDLENSTEIVLDARRKVKAPKHPVKLRPAMTSGGGAGGRAAAGAIRISNAVGAAFTNRRVLEPVEGRLMVLVGLLLLSLAAIGWFKPGALAYPLIFLLAWGSLALIYRGIKLWSEQPGPKALDRETAVSDSRADAPVRTPVRKKG